MPKSPPNPSKTLRILLVDPDRDDRIATRALLSTTDLPVEITVTPWVPTARALLDNVYDCALICTQLPDAFALIHEASMKGAVIALSSVDISQAGPAVRAGAHDLILKSDLDREALKNALFAAISHHRATPSVFHTEQPTQQVAAPPQP